jgi:hypothetical protein
VIGQIFISPSYNFPASSHVDEWVPAFAGMTIEAM